jgi:arylsulfatase A-like enzyme
MKCGRLSALVLAALLSAAPAFAAPDMPNVIILSVDALRADHASCYGYCRATTPNIDRLAGQGVMFMDASALIPLTNPSITTLFTSMPPCKTGVSRNGISLPKGAETLPGLLRARGYTTVGVVGSWPLHRSRSGQAHSFDHYLDRYLSVMMELDAGTLTRRVQALLDQGVSEPFFLWVHYADPHQPHLPKSDHSFRADRTGGNKRSRTVDYFDCEVAYADHWIGVLIDDLEQKGLLDNALVIITADHGENLGGQGGRNFVGHGRALYQSILRVPLILCGPDLPAGQRINDPVQMLDISPTVLAYLDLPPGGEMEGRDLLPAIMEGHALDPVPFYFETYSVAVPDFPGLDKLGARTGPVAIGMRVGPIKITYGFWTRTWEMYNLDDDPGEKNNLFDPDDPRFRLLAEELRKWYVQRERPGPDLPDF